jgi:hypothetical protein
MWLKLLPYAGALVIGIVVGSFGTIKIANGLKTECPKCPELRCPEVPPCPPQTKVELGTFDAEKINMKKGTLHYSPHLENVQVVLDCSDSVFLKQLLRGK